jgi:hypothetical protein
MSTHRWSRQRLLEVLAAGLFLTQLIHLIWMSTYVVPIRLWGTSIWSPPSAPLALADYLELPAIITTSLLYVRTRNWKMLILVNLQLFHILWITDEFVLNRGSLNPVLAWIAITIDYLEIPVIFDTIGRVIRSNSGRRDSVPTPRSG